MTVVNERLDRFLSAKPKQRAEEFKTVKYVALLLGRDESTVRQLVQQDKLEALKIGGRILIYAPSIKRWLEESNRD